MVCDVVVKIKVCQRHSVAVLSVPSYSCRRLSIFLPHISHRGSWDGRVEAGIDYRWILHRPAGPAARKRPSPTISFINDQQRLLRPHQTQRLPSTHHDHESRFSSSIITKSTHSSPPQPTDRTFTRMLITLDGSGVHRQRTTLAHTTSASPLAQITTLCRMK